MDLFKFRPGADPTVLTGGEPINGATTITWTERYREAGEFEIIAPMSSGLMQFLPLGTIISHTNTLVAMIVENHNLTEDPETDPVISITGRSLEAILEDRIVGSNQASSTTTVSDYTLASADTWAQIKTMVNAHIQTPTDTNERLPNIYCEHQVTGTGTRELRTVNRGDLYAAVLELLSIDNLGMKSIRRNPFGVEGAADRTYLMVHKGKNRAKDVIFSWKAGDLESSEYLWSNRTLKNAAMVVGRYVQTKVNLGVHGYNRSVMLVDASDIDGHLSAVPTGSVLTDIVAKMQTRGRQRLAKQSRVDLIRADVSEITPFVYRRDFNIGDIITVDGNFGEIAPMRVVEYVEIQDENEERGHPTFDVPNPVNGARLRSGNVWNH